MEAPGFWDNPEVSNTQDERAEKLKGYLWKTMDHLRDSV